MPTSSDFHVHVTLEFSNERETVWYNERVVFPPLVKYPMRVDGGFFLGRFGVAKPARPYAVLPLLAVFEGILGRGGGVADDGRVVEGMDHELANDASIIGRLRNMGRNDPINILR
jgi:hypothetical protein